MAIDPTRITCQGICSRPVAWEEGTDTLVSYIYRAGDDVSFRFRRRADAFATESVHPVQTAILANGNDSFDETSLDTNKWDDLSTGAAGLHTRAGYLRLAAGLDADLSDDFADTTIDTDRWTTTGDIQYLSQDETLNFVKASGIASALTGLTSQNKNTLLGNFDLQLYIEGSGIGTALTGDQYAQLEALTLSESNQVYVGHYRRSSGTREWQSEYFVNDVSQAVATASAAPSGWVRIHRSSNTITTHYSTDGTSWTQLQSFSLPPASGGIYADINGFMRLDPSPSFEANVDDYTAALQEAGSAHVRSTWKLVGDYEIHIPWSIHRAQAINTSEFSCKVTTSIFDNTAFTIGVRRNDSSLQYFGGYSASDPELVTAATAVGASPSGWFRLTRVGGQMTSYYGQPGSWTMFHTSVADNKHNQNIELLAQSLDSYPVVDVHVPDVILASGNAYYVDPTSFDIQVQDAGALELVFVSGNRMFRSVRPIALGDFPEPEGVLIWNEGTKIAQAFDASISKGVSEQILTYVDEDRRVRVVTSVDGGSVWTYPTFANTIVESSGSPSVVESVYDDSLNVYTITWDSDIDSEYDTLYTSFGLITLGSPSGVLVLAETPAWNPIVEAGFVYMEDREYYLYSNKQVVERTPTASGTFTLPTFSSRPILGPPIVITDASSYSLAEASGNPFAKTWEPPRGEGITYVNPTPEKYRRRWDLSDRKEFRASPSGDIAYTFSLGAEYPKEFYVEWGDVDINGGYTPTIRIANSGSILGDVIIEYEHPDASGWYVVDHVDVNPLHSPNMVNRFLMVREDTPEPNQIYLDVGSTTMIGPSGSTPVYATVYDTYGSPVQDQLVTFFLSPDDGANTFGSLDPLEATTSFDGSTATTYFAPSGTLLAVKGAIGAGIIVVGSVGDPIIARDSVSIPLGFPAA